MIKNQKWEIKKGSKYSVLDTAGICQKKCTFQEK